MVGHTRLQDSCYAWQFGNGRVWSLTLPGCRFQFMVVHTKLTVEPQIFGSVFREGNAAVAGSNDAMVQPFQFLWSQKLIRYADI